METVVSTSYTSKAGFGTINSTKEDVFWDTLEFNRLGISALLLLFVPCLSAIAMSFGGLAFELRLFCTGLATVLFVVSFLGLLSMRWVLGSAAIATGIALFFALMGFLGF